MLLSECSHPALVFVFVFLLCRLEYIRRYALTGGVSPGATPRDKPGYAASTAAASEAGAYEEGAGAEGEYQYQPTKVWPVVCLLSFFLCRVIALAQRA